MIPAADEHIALIEQMPRTKTGRRGLWRHERQIDFTALDPMAYSPDDPRNARVVIDACRPWSRRDTFPIEARSSKELDELIRAKFGEDLPKGF